MRLEHQWKHKSTQTALVAFEVRGQGVVWAGAGMGWQPAHAGRFGDLEVRGREHYRGSWRPHAAAATGCAAAAAGSSRL